VREETQQPDAHYTREKGWVFALTASFYRRPLPETQIAFASTEGRALFREALAAGTMESFFAQAEQFHTQQEPAFCGLATLVVALNALSIDPGRLWKGPWRWYGEELLDCCAPLEKVKHEGITLDQFACLARCNGAVALVTRASDATTDRLRRAIHAASSTAEGEVLAISYTRKVLGQTGDGHFSTIAGYHQARDLALVLDVARFKYPPHWAPVSLLFDAMLPLDPATGRTRGFVHLSRGEHPPLAYRLSPHDASWSQIAHALNAMDLGAPSTLEEAVERFIDALPPELVTLVEPQEAETPEHRELVCTVSEALRATTVGHAVQRVRGHADDVTTMLVLLAPGRIFGALVGPLDLPAALAAELARLREQLEVMISS